MYGVRNVLCIKVQVKYRVSMSIIRLDVYIAVFFPHAVSTPPKLSREITESSLFVS